MLIARKDPRRHPRVAARWLLRYLEECADARIDEAAMVAACLAALSGDRHRDAALTLRAMAERATSRRRTRRGERPQRCSRKNGLLWRPGCRNALAVRLERVPDLADFGGSFS
jgi:hypothetical protein